METIKVKLEIENKEEIENWVHGLVEQLHEASGVEEKKNEDKQK
ncbi:hypothetical protein [uncultured Faecalicoccus sp.]|nr:hypothetical protein [uncultured Faecalicoccus sp.]